MSIITPTGAYAGTRQFASAPTGPVPNPATADLEYVAASGGRYMQNLARIRPRQPPNCTACGCNRPGYYPGGRVGPILGDDPATYGPSAAAALAAVAGGQPPAMGSRGPSQSVGVALFDHPYTAELVRQATYGINGNSVGQFAVQYEPPYSDRRLMEYQAQAQAAQVARDVQAAQAGALAATSNREVVTVTAGPNSGQSTTTVTVGNQQAYAPTITSGVQQSPDVAGLARVSSSSISSTSIPTGGVSGASGPAPVTLAATGATTAGQQPAPGQVGVINDKGEFVPFARPDPIAQVQQPLQPVGPQPGGGGNIPPFHYMPRPYPDGPFSYTPQIPFVEPIIWPQPVPLTAVGNVVLQDAIAARRHGEFMDPWATLSSPFSGGPVTPMWYASPVDFGMDKLKSPGCGRWYGI